MTTQLSFENLSELNSFVSKTARGFRVFSRTNRIKAEGALSCTFKLNPDEMLSSYGLEVPEFFGASLYAIVYGIEYGITTGRLSHNAEQMLNSMSGYNFAKFVIRLALAKATMHDVVAYLNGNKSITLPIKEA